MSVLIVKNNGEKEPFSEEKLKRSLKRVGASDEVRDHVIAGTKEKLYDGITTQEIYEYAFELLRDEEKRPVAARYSIKRAVLDLGPSGFPFEQFVAKIVETMGYTNVRTGVAAQGKCAPHEVDVMADHEDKHMAAEVKFHNSLGIKTDLKVALYVHARFEDLRKSSHHIDEGWLITNTRFTRNVVKFATCGELELLGWDYPRGRGLEVLIDEAHVHPITALTTLTNKEKESFLSDNIVLCRQIRDQADVLRRYGIDPGRHKEVLDEINGLCTIKT